MKHLIELDEWEIFSFIGGETEYERDVSLTINGQHITSNASDLDPLLLNTILEALGLNFEIKIKNTVK